MRTQHETLKRLQPSDAITILIIDDEKEIRSVLKRILRKQFPQSTLYEASDGIQGFRMTLQVHPDFILMDLMMPGKNGIQVSQDIQNEHPQPAPIIFGITGYYSAENINSWMKQGVTSCLLKPFVQSDVKLLFKPHFDSNNKKLAAPQKMKEEDHSPSFIANLACLLGISCSSFSIPEQLLADPTSPAKLNEFAIQQNLYNHKFAVLTFKSFDRNINGKAFSDSLVECLLKKISDIRIMERDDLPTILSEHAFMLTGATQQKDSLQGKPFEAIDAVIMGTVRTLENIGEDGGAVIVTVKIINISNGEILWSHKQESRCYSIAIDRNELTEELTHRAVIKIVKKMKNDFFKKYKIQK